MSEELTRTVALYKSDANWLQSERGKGEKMRDVFRRFRQKYEELEAEKK